MDLVSAVTMGELSGSIVALVVGAGQCGLIFWGLRQMSKASEIRSKQVDNQGEALREMGNALRDQSAGIRELLERTGPSM